MGWASGSELAEEVWLAVRDYIPEGRERALVARTVIDAFENCDCDTMDEAEVLCRDARRKTWADFDGDYEKFEELPEYEDLEEDTDG